MLKLKLHVQFWADLPHEVLATVLSLLPTAQCWKARRVSKAWARQVRQTTSFEVTIRAKPSNLARKVQALFRQQLQQRLPYAVITFQITWPLHLDNLLVLLQTLRDQVSTCKCPALLSDLAVSVDPVCRHLSVCCVSAEEVPVKLQT